MRYFGPAALGLCLAASGITGARAGDKPVLIELYTSQGCSSCPAADAILAGLAGRDDVIALALHVDYWDYIGWPDTFAKPAFTERQKAYARATGAHTIYTPQMIVGGSEQLIGAQPGELVETLAREFQRPDAVTLDLVRNGGDLVIRAEATGKLAEPAVVQVVRYIPEQTVDIEHGENAGRHIEYHNIVTDWDVLGSWDGSAPLDLTVPLSGDQPVVVVVQEAGPGRVLAAERLR